MPSFDVVCELDMHEVTNAVDQANREVGTRFDFKGSDAKFTCQENTITLVAQNEFQLNQMIDILNKKLAKRNVDLRHMEIVEPEIALHKAEQKVTLHQGIPEDKAKKMIKLIKEQKFKVQAGIHGDKIRVTGKSRDDLQSVIHYLRTQTSVELPLQFNNFRD